MQKNLLLVKNFKCKRCQAAVLKSSQKKVYLHGDKIKVVVEKFCYLGDVLSADGKVHNSVVFGIRARWNKFKELPGILCGRGLSQRIKGTVQKLV